MHISSDNCVVGVFYGEPEDLSANYKKIARDYPVYVGQEFWWRLTGDEDFYSKLISVFGDVAKEMDCSDLLNNTIAELAKNFTH